ncbi:MAG: energy-coupling factor ABC transporter ATP-binding protein [Fervidicoccaceae archaeon]|jgi:cobalt/nickel transport system ATP-binding protein
MKIAELKDVYYKYPDGTEALKGISLAVNDREVLCMFGPNGAGKSTVLLMLDALIFPQKGTVRLFGSEVDPKNASELRKKIGLLFQNPDDMLFNPTVLEEVSFGLISRGMGREEAKRKAEKELSKMGLEKLMERIPHRLSFGQRRLVSLASVIVTEPELLLLDEPTSNLDRENKTKIIARLLEYIEERGEKSWGIVIASQDEELKGICNDIIYIEDGRILEGENS